MNNKKNIKHKKNVKSSAKHHKSSVYYAILIIVCIMMLLFLYDRYFPKKIKDSYDTEIIASADVLKKDVLIKTYEEYETFLKSYTGKNYDKNLSKSPINREKFIEYDYVALFYDTRSCYGGESTNHSLSQLKTKIVLSVTRYEDSSCKNITRVTFLPVEKNKYEEIPNVVVKKEIIKE